MQRRAKDWKKCALELAGLLPKTRLHPKVVKWADARRGRERWSVAVSGGADSLVLLLLLWAHWPKRRERLLALHFDHCLRGAESRADAAFCRRVCASLGVEIVAAKWTQAPKQASEAAARAARFEFFRGELKARRIRVLWLGQQQDDIAETMLMRLARGSGTAGLAAPRPLQDHLEGRVHVRPLLTIKKGEIVTVLERLRVSWREDSSNAHDDYFRNRVRRRVMPAWRDAAGRDALAGAAFARELLEEDDSALEYWLKELAVKGNDGAVELEKLKGKPRALYRRAVRNWLVAQPGLGELSRQGFDRLLSAAEAGADTRQSLGDTKFAIIRRQRLSLQKARIRAD